MYYYEVTGYVYRCSEKIPQLYETAPTDDFDVEILIKNVPDEISAEVKKMPDIPYFYWTSDYVWLHNTYGLFAVYKSGKIYLQASDSENKLILLQFVLGYGIAMYAHLNGKIAIHCGCVYTHGNGILITGVSGSGKSTLTAELISDGAVMLADDMIAAGYDDTGFPTIYPAFPQQKLCRDAAIKKGYNLDDLIYIDPDKDKFAVNRADIFSPYPHQLNFAFELVCYDPKEYEKYDSKVLVKKLEGFDKVDVFKNQLFLGEIFAQIGFPPEQFKMCIDLVNYCKVYRIYRPMGRNTLPEIQRFIYRLCNEQNEHYINLLKAAIFKEKVSDDIVNAISLPELYQFGTLNKISVLCSSILDNWELGNETETANANWWKIDSAKTIFKEHQKIPLIRQILEKANITDLPLIFFKGYILADLYPDFTFRNSGDTDLYVDKENYSHIVDIFTQIGYTEDKKLAKPSVHTFFYYENDDLIHKIELHTSLYEDMTGKCIDILNRLDMTNMNNCIRLDCCGLNVLTLSHTNHLIYQIFHMVKHICCHGISVRYLADISLFLKRYETDIDINKLWNTMDELGYHDFCLHLLSLCVRFMNVDSRVLNNNPTVYEDTTKALLNDLVHFGMRNEDPELSGQFFYFEQYIEAHYDVQHEIHFDGNTVPYSVVASKWQNNIVLQKRIKMLNDLKIL
mgnify:CR=1 FL=1